MMLGIPNISSAIHPRLSVVAEPSITQEPDDTEIPNDGDVTETKSGVRKKTFRILSNRLSKREVFYDRLKKFRDGEPLVFTKLYMGVAHFLLMNIRKTVTDDHREEYRVKYKRLLDSDMNRLEELIGRMSPKNTDPVTRGSVEITINLIDYFDLLPKI